MIAALAQVIGPDRVVFQPTQIKTIEYQRVSFRSKNDFLPPDREPF